GLDAYHRDCAEEGVHRSVRRLYSGLFQLYPGRPVAFGRHPHTCACSGVGWRVSHQGERRGCRGDRGERSAHRAKRHRLRESSPSAPTGCGTHSVKRPDQMVHTHQTAPTRFVEANGIRFAYRRFGNAAGIPLVFNQHFTGTMDHWDPAVTDGLAKEREVILFNNAGVASSSGQVPTSIEGMAANAIAFIGALGLPKVDVLGFSIGGLVAQEIAGQAPRLVRKLVLVGTGPRGGEGMANLTPEAQQIFGATYQEPDHLWLAVHFTRSEASQAAGRDFLKRFRLRKENRDPEVNEKVAPAQLEALGKWGIQFKGSYDYLKAISQPTLVVNGGKDVIVYSVNSFILQQHLPNAQLILYPDANHGSQYKYPELFVRHVSMFLSADERRGVGGSKAGTFRHSNNRTMIMATLTGKTALVTGASRGIGRAGALALAAAGAQVLVHYGR